MTDSEREAIEATVYHDLSKLRRTMRLAVHVVPVANVPPSMVSAAGRLLCEPIMTAGASKGDVPGLDY